MNLCLSLITFNSTYEHAYKRMSENINVNIKYFLKRINGALKAKRDQFNL